MNPHYDDDLARRSTASLPERALVLLQSIETLQGSGPASFKEHCLDVAEQMLILGEAARDSAEARNKAEEALADGSAWEHFLKLVEAQGGDPSFVEDPSLIPEAPHLAVVEAPGEGSVQRVDPRALGYGVVELGGGRRRVEDSVDLRVGFRLSVGVGDAVEEGTPLGEVHASDLTGLDRGREILEGAITLGPPGEVVSLPPRIRDRVPPAS
jgi:thymidine phosphorylase